jgi:hypothetical protein
MQAVVLDSEGRLLEFQARPPAVALTDYGPGASDWYKLFAAAGLDFAAFKAVQPELTPASAFDAQAAWTGSGQGDRNLRVEAAAYQGRPVSFRVLGPWTRPSEPTPVSFGSLSTPMFIVGLLALPAAAGLLAWRNARMGRGDRRGAFRLAAFLFLFSLLDNLAAAHHVPTATEFALLFATLSWNRLLAGRPRDAMVGGHLLVGVALGVLICVANAFAPLPFVSAFAPKLPWSNVGFFSLWCGELIAGVAGGLSFALILNLLSILVRRRWLGVLVFVLMMTLLLAPGYGALSFEALARPVVALLIVAITLTRFGVLATVASVYTRFILQDFPLTTNWSAWYEHATLLGLATLAGLALFGFVITLKSRPLWSNRLDAD